ncbi:DNA-directed RNA polymerases II, IV and V subunit 11-like isoform X1 [Glycine max]|uniref:DNA-directed RNA polymerases II, IV and V subunit 11-like isoform X1 n=1 Tax=Glycine max TaxID=3847 RepID=UPI001B354D5F|nr:uncharacterized protein LOC100784219 isoform X1 [Glycine max]
MPQIVTSVSSSLKAPKRFLMRGTRRSSMRRPSPSRERSTLSATSSACTPVLLPPCSHFPVSPRNPNFSLFFMFFRQLHRDPNVLFAGYKLPHPLQYKIIVRIHTTSQSSPMQAYNQSVNDLDRELDHLKSAFEAEMLKFSRDY